MDKIKTNITVGGVVQNKDGMVAVVQMDNDKWSLPKGRNEDGEDLVETARREIEEETGIEALELVKKLGEYKRHQFNDNGEEDLSILKNVHIFYFKTDQNELNPSEGDIADAKFVQKEKVIKYLSHPKDREFFLSIIDELD